MLDEPLERYCARCDSRYPVAPAVGRCPSCGQPFGRLAFGMDVDPAEAARMDRDRQGDTDRAYRRMLDQTRKDQMRRAVLGDDV